MQKVEEDVSLETLAEICHAVSVPVVAIGGININNVLKLSGRGIQGIAVISGIFASDDIETATAKLKEKTIKMLNGGK